MIIRQSRKENELTVSPEGRLDSATSGEFQEFLTENFTADIEKLILDFSGVDFISSKGIRVIVAVYKNLGERKLAIISANAAVVEVFRLSGLLKVLDVNGNSK